MTKIFLGKIILMKPPYTSMENNTGHPCCHAKINKSTMYTVFRKDLLDDHQTLKPSVIGFTILKSKVDLRHSADSEALQDGVSTNLRGYGCHDS